MLEAFASEIAAALSGGAIVAALGVWKKQDTMGETIKNLSLEIKRVDDSRIKEDAWLDMHERIASIETKVDILLKRSNGK